MPSFRLNGIETTFGDAERDLTLLDFVRRSGLTGAKEGCAEGECGACAVAVVRPYGAGSTYRVMNSCLMPLAVVEGHEVLTIEGIAASGQDAALRALAEGGGSQCGYCTPGFAVSLTAEHCRPDRAGACSTEALAGNLCRCTGYRPIADAAASLVEPATGALSDRLRRPAPAILPTRSPGFVRADSIEECIDALGATTGAVAIAGGTDLGIEHNRRDRRFDLLVSLEAVDELRAFSADDQRVLIGAALPLSELEDRWTDAPPVWRTWFALFASPLIRNRATLGGNLATASPIGDSAPLLMALDAVVHVAGPSGRRTIPAAQLFSGYRKTVLGRDELIVAVELRMDGQAGLAGRAGLSRTSPGGQDSSAPPRSARSSRSLVVQEPDSERRLKPAPTMAGGLPQASPGEPGRPGGPGGPGRAVAFYKMAKRRLNDISTVTAAIAVERAGDGRVTQARFCFGGVAATPVRVEAAEQAVLGSVWDDAATARVQAVLGETLHPLSDHRGTREFRLAIVQSLVAKFAWEHLR